MKKYQQIEGGSYVIGDLEFPASGRFFRKMQEEISAGEAELIAYSGSELDFSTLQDEAGSEIDLEAGRARARFISAGEGILQEYDRAYVVALAYRDAGYPGDAVPSSVAANMRYKGLTPQLAADDIIGEGDALNDVLDRIRDIRLDGKLAVKNTVEGDDLDQVISPFVSLLGSIKPS